MSIGTNSAVERPIDLVADFLAIASGLTLTGLALHPAFGAPTPVFLTLWGGAVAVGVSNLAIRRGLGPLGFVLALFLAFIIAGGPSVADSALFGILPSPAGAAALVKGLVHAWSDATTTAPPVGTSNGLGVIPYAGGFVAGACSYLLARRTALSVVPVAPILVLLAGNILLGIREPQSLGLQGGAMAVVALAWGSHREARRHRVGVGGIYIPRLFSSVGMLVGVMLVSLLLGPRVFATSFNDRYVVREHVEPPIDLRAYSSPLNGFRNYIADANKKTEFFKVRGLPRSARIRLATMDTYTGTVWAVGGPTAPASGFFDRVGTSILPTPPGRKIDVEFEVLGYSGIWVPTVGATRVNRFTGLREEALNGSFRFNRATGDGVSLVPLAKGDEFVVEERVPDDQRSKAVGKRVAADVLGGLPPLPDIPDDLRERASELIRGATTDYEKAEVLEKFFQDGYYSDGGAGVASHMRSAPGHSVYRIQKFLAKERARPVGDAEQYAAAMALIARLSGLPARVVMGFDVPKEDRSEVTIVRGTHVHAWVEIAFEDVGWVAFDPTPDRDRLPEPQPLEQPKVVMLEIPPEPIHKYVRPPDLDTAQDRDQSSSDDADNRKLSGALLPGWIVATGRYLGLPMLLMGGVLGLIVGLKGLRRRRRRTAGTPVDRVIGAWLDSVSSLRDLGVALSRGATRLETASEVPPQVWSGAIGLADVVDESIFGPVPPNLEAIQRIWEIADRERASMLAGLSRLERLKVAVSLRSLIGVSFSLPRIPDLLRRKPQTQGENM